MSKEIIVASNNYWRLVVTTDASGVYIGAGRVDEAAGGMYISDEQQDELIFRLMQLRRNRRKKNAESDNS